MPGFSASDITNIFFANCGVLGGIARIVLMSRGSAEENSEQAMKLYLRTSCVTEQSRRFCPTVRCWSFSKKRIRFKHKAALNTHSDFKVAHFVNSLQDSANKLKHSV